MRLVSQLAASIRALCKKSRLRPTFYTTGLTFCTNMSLAINSKKKQVKSYYRISRRKCQVVSFSRNITMNSLNKVTMIIKYSKAIAAPLSAYGYHKVLFEQLCLGTP